MWAEHVGNTAKYVVIKMEPGFADRTCDFKGLNIVRGQFDSTCHLLYSANYKLHIFSLDFSITSFF